MGRISVCKCRESSGSAVGTGPLAEGMWDRRPTQPARVTSALWIPRLGTVSSHAVCTEASSGISGLLGTHASHQGPARLVAPTGEGPTGCSPSPGCGVGRPFLLSLSFAHASNSQVILASTEGPRSQVDVSVAPRGLELGREGELQEGLSLPARPLTRSGPVPSLGPVAWNRAGRGLQPWLLGHLHFKTTWAGFPHTYIPGPHPGDPPISVDGPASLCLQQPPQVIVTQDRDGTSGSPSPGPQQSPPSGGLADPPSAPGTFLRPQPLPGPEAGETGWGLASSPRLAQGMG